MNELCCWILTENLSENTTDLVMRNVAEFGKVSF